MPVEKPVPAHAMVASLRRTIRDTLGPLLPRGARVALVDFPNHSNVGDSAIWLGELAYLEDAGCEIVHRCDTRNYSRDQLSGRVGQGTILLHGGGNLGDLYQRHQDFRERVISDFPANEVIQLPQTMHFQNPEHLARARRAFNAHPNLTLLLRDRRSLEVAGNEFRAQVRLAPDMAFCMGMATPSQPTRDIVCLLRTEVESAGAATAARQRGIEGCDWLEDESSPLLSAFAAVDGWSRRYSRRFTALGQRLWAELATAVARQRLARGYRMLAAGRVVITDRLHGHILSLLLGRPHVVMDNSYGKLGDFLDTWTDQCQLTHRANSLDDALGIAGALVRGEAGPA